ncbi:MAG: APC family permease [Firmicutes bacterium]|nr:APC family permease [Bacillota bacterium]
MEKRYGLPTAIAMVVGIVIGSGVFIKGGKVLAKTGGNLALGILVICCCGVICIICSLVFAELSSKWNQVNGLVDYAEVALGSKYAYYMGWFQTTIYTPSLAAILAFFSGLFFCQLIGVRTIDLANGCFSAEVFGVGGGFLIMGYAVNALSPKLAGKLQVSMTVIKLIPLCVIGIIGTIIGLSNGATQNVLDFVNTSAYVPLEGGFFKGIVAFAFSFEGWVLATTINSELKDPQKNLPKALIGGALFTVAIYVLYIFSMSSVGSVEEILATWPLGQNLIFVVSEKLFGGVVAKIFGACVVVSCLGTMNGLIMANCRSQYSIASRGMGLMADWFADIDQQNNFPIKSAIFGMLFSGFWYAWDVVMYWNGPDFMGTTHSMMFFGFEPDEVCIVNLYAMYIPMFIALMVKCADFGFLKRYILPILGIACCVFMVVCCVIGWGVEACLGYLTFFVVFMIVGRVFMHPERAIKKF